MGKQTNILWTISIIIPVYNVQKYVNKCIDSVLNQTYSRFEVIAIDDGSEDDSGMILDECAQRDSRILVIHKENGGVSSARNCGLEIAKGDFVFFLDADDWIEPYAIEKMIQNVGESDILAFSYNIIRNGSQEFIIRNPWNYQKLEKFKTTDLFHDIFARTAILCNKLYRRSVIGNTRFSTSMDYGEDAYFQLQVYKNAKSGVIICEPLYNYYMEREGNVVSASIDQRSIRLLEVSKRMYEELRQIGQVSCGIRRLKTSVNEVLKKLMKCPRKERRQYKRYCFKTIHYPSLNDILVFLRDHRVSIKVKMNFLFFYFTPELYCKYKYKV